MRWSGNFDSYERCTAVPILTITPVFVYVSVFLCLFIPSVSHATCSNETDVASGISPFLYDSDVWPNKGSIRVEKTNSHVKWNALGVIHLHKWNVKGANDDIKKAEECFVKSSEDKYPPALNNLGVIYLNGWGVDRDVDKAKKYFNTAASERYIPALNNLGVIELREALDDPKVLDISNTFSDAVMRIQQAAKAGYPPAWNNLGIIHLSKQNYAKAIDEFKRAAKFDYVPALFNLGASYARGYGDDPDYPRAAKLYEKAARKGNVDAQFSLGLMYSHGIGVEKSLVDSYTWLDVATKNGFAGAAKIQSVLEKRLTGEQMATVKQKSKAILVRDSWKIRAIDPLTLYDDVAAAPELYQRQLPDSWKKQKNWVSAYYERTQE